MDHSVRGYLSRRSDEELKSALRYCLEQDDDFYQDIISMIFDILENRLICSANDA